MVRAKVAVPIAISGGAYCDQLLIIRRGRWGQVEAELRGELMGIFEFTESHRNKHIGNVRTNDAAADRNRDSRNGSRGTVGVLSGRSLRSDPPLMVVVAFHHPARDQEDVSRAPQRN